MSVAQDRHVASISSRPAASARLTPRAPTADDPAAFTADIFTTEDGLPSGDFQPAARLVDAAGQGLGGDRAGPRDVRPEPRAPDRTPKPLVIEVAKVIEAGPHPPRGRVALAPPSGTSGSSMRSSPTGRVENPLPVPARRLRPAALGAGPRAPPRNTRTSGAGDYMFQVWGKDARGNVSGPVRPGLRDPARALADPVGPRARMRSPRWPPDTRAFSGGCACSQRRTQRARSHGGGAHRGARGLAG